MCAMMTTKGNARTPALWLKEFGNREHILPMPGRLDWTQFTDDSGVTVTVDTGGAAQNATSIPIVALTSPEVTVQPLVAAGQVLIPARATISFGAAGSGKFAKLTADAKYGDVSLAVEALPTALVALDAGVYSGFATEYIQSGKLVGRTYAEAASSSDWGPANVLTDDEIFLTVFDVPNARVNPDCEFLRHGSAIAINFLPGYDTMVADTGIANPTVAPTLTHSGTDGPATAGLRYVGYTFFNANGETKLSPLASVTTLTTEHIGIADIAVPAGALGIKFYSSESIGDTNVTFNKALAAHGATTLTTDGVGSDPPAVNTTKGAAGSALDWLRSHYRCMIGEA